MRADKATREKLNGAIFSFQEIVLIRVASEFPGGSTLSVASGRLWAWSNIDTVTVSQTAQPALDKANPNQP